MTKTKKERQQAVNKDHDKKNMIVLGGVVAVIILVMFSIT